MIDLQVTITDVQPVARRVIALRPDYPWGDGVPENSNVIEPGEPDACNAVSPNRKPSKWPNNLDWRNPGFQPWNRSTGNPMPAAFSAVFSIDSPSSPWPDKSDDGKLFYMYPEQDPSAPANTTRWYSVGLNGGTLFVTCDYVQFDDRTEFEPAGSLLTTGEAVLAHGHVGVEWKQDRETFSTFAQYTGPNQWFGPLPIGPYTGTETSKGVCGLCSSVDFAIKMPQLKLGTDSVFGNFVAQLNGFESPHVPDQPINECRWSMPTSRVFPYQSSACTGQDVDIFMLINATISVNFSLTLMFLNITYENYLQGILFNCRETLNRNCCEDIASNFDDPTDVGNDGGASSTTFRYIAGGPTGLETCQLLRQHFTDRPWTKQSESGTFWAGRAPDNIVTTIV